MARYGMLICGKNFQGTLKQQCNQCDTMDNEDHRLNTCPKWETNFLKEEEKTNFETIFTTNLEEIKVIVKKIQRVWNVKTGNGSMN